MIHDYLVVDNDKTRIIKARSRYWAKNLHALQNGYFDYNEDRKKYLKSLKVQRLTLKSV